MTEMERMGAAAKAAEDAVAAVLLRSFWKAEMQAEPAESTTEVLSTLEHSSIPLMTGARPWISSAAPA